MFRAAVLGHSLVPLSLCVSDLPGVTVDLYRYPGATIDSLTSKSDLRDFWTQTYDLAILCISGNDLACDEVDLVFDKLCTLARRVNSLTGVLNISTVEYRLYLLGHRFGVDQETYQRKVIKINRKI